MHFIGLYIFFELAGLGFWLVVTAYNGACIILLGVGWVLIDWRYFLNPSQEKLIPCSCSSNAWGLEISLTCRVSGLWLTSSQGLEDLYSDR